uniref:ARAD1D33572p n=1 Tax=Blastobotrys adeninivorans TaxID=409370 RepID=A0A060TC61_BLAAD
MRIRKSFAGAFVALCVGAGFLGLSPGLSMDHDKILHGVVFFLLATALYWTVDGSKRQCMNLTAIVVGGFGGVGSEFVQSFVVPQRKFDAMDIVANLVGTGASLGLSTWYHGRLSARRRAARYRMLRGDPEQSAGQPAEDTAIEMEASEQAPTQPSTQSQTQASASA